MQRSQAKFRWTKLYVNEPVFPKTKIRNGKITTKVVPPMPTKTKRVFAGYRTSNRKMVPCGNHHGKEPAIFDATDPNAGKDFLEFDTSPLILRDDRYSSKYRAKILFFSLNYIDVEPESLVRQTLWFKDFRPKDVDLLHSLHSWYFHMLKTKQSRLKPLIYNRNNNDMPVIWCTIIGYHGKYRIEFDDPQYVKLASVASVHDR